MRTDNIKLHNNFGWNPAVHAKITKAALKHIPVLQQFEEEIVVASTYPKLHLHFANFLNPKHCYYGKELTRYNNDSTHAFDMFERAMKDAAIDFEFEEDKTAINGIGEALHFLQDVADPVHTQPNQKSIFKISTFRKYDKLSKETDIDSIMQEVHTSATTDNLYDLFGDTYERSYSHPNPLDDQNAIMLPTLVKKYLKDTCVSTVAFLKRLGNIYNLTDDHRCQVAIDESINSAFLREKLGGKIDL